MYNRYVPQPDGSYQRSRFPEYTPPAAPPRKQEEPAPCCDSKPAEPPTQPPKPQRPSGRPCCAHMPRQGKKETCGLGIGEFLRSLFPKDFDTGDLIVILLLLLMSSDCQEDQNTALLTLALYVFL